MFDGVDAVVLRAVLEHARVQRAALIVVREGELQVEALASRHAEGIDVDVRRRRLDVAKLPEGMIQLAARTREPVVDVSEPDPVTGESRFVGGCGRSMMCLPIPTETDLRGVLYVENNPADHAFAPEQIAILSTLASQVAASLENVELYARAEKSRKRLSLLIDTIPILAWSARVDGYADYFNKRWLDYTGMTTEQATGWKWTSAVHPNDATGLRVTWERLLEAAEAGEAEARLRRTDGAYRWFLFRAQPLFDDLGKVVEWYGTNTDIEERKLAELELSDRLRFWTLRSELATTFALAPADQLGGRLDAALRRVGEFFDLDRVTIYALPTTGDDATITHEWTKAGTSRQSLKVDALPFARAVATLQRGDDVRIPTVEEMPEHWRGEREQLKTLGVRSVVGLPMIIGGVTIALIGLACSSRKVDWSDDTLQQMHLLGEVFANVLARQHAAIELEHSATALDHAQRDLARITRATTMGELAASIAHEINQPLAAVVANATACHNWLSGPTPDLPAVRQAIEAITRDGDRAGQVLTRIRALLGRSPVAVGPCDLSVVVDAILPLVQGQLRRDGITLETALAKDLPRVMGDAVQLQQVVLNLVLNAAEASRDVASDRRRVIVRTSAERLDDTPSVVVSVEDAGVGLDTEVERLFETFYTTKTTGLGMGLSISRSIIERHDGRLWAEPNIGPGATFRFALAGIP